MTENQLEEEVRMKFNKAAHLLQMPPILKIMEDNPKIISQDPALTGFSAEDSSFVFTDITFGMKDSDRSVVIRTSDGVLQEAPYSVRKHVCQIYIPRTGRKFREPKMFDGDFLKQLIQNEEYTFLLDRLCIQFEPFEPKFHEVTSLVYQHISENQKFDSLRSTRYFGPMAFTFAWHKSIDDLLLDMIRRDYLKNGVELIFLMFNLNGIKADKSILKELQLNDNTERHIKSTIDALLSKTSLSDQKINKTREDLEADEICFQFIQDQYLKQHSQKQQQLEMALQSYKERHNELKSIAQGVN